MMANAIPAGCGALQRGNRDAPAARRTDPESSHLAAERITRSGRRASQQDHAHAAVESFPGLTSAELAQETGIDRYELARRLPECAFAGRIRRGSIRLCDVSARPACTWWPAP